MKKRRKTEYGYITYQKRMQLFLTALMGLIGLLIYFLGCGLLQEELAKVSTVAAILMVLPGAKHLVSFIVLLPYTTPDRKQYEELLAEFGERGSLYSDLVITSADKVMNLDFLLVEEGCVLGVLGKKGQNLSYVQQYLSKGVRNWGTDYKVKIYGEYKELKKELQENRPKQSTSEAAARELSEVEAYLKALIV